MKNFLIKSFEHFKISKILSQSFLFIVLIVFIMTTVLSAFLYDKFYKLTYTSIGINMVERLNQNSTQLNLLKNQIYTIGTYLTKDTEIVKASVNKETNPVEKYLLVAKLGYYTNTNKLIHSIFLYNPTNQEIITNLGASPKWIYDRNLKTYLSTIDETTSQTFIPRILETGDLPTTRQNVFSISFKVDTNDSTKGKAYQKSNIILNVNANNFFKDILFTNSYSTSDTLLLDQNGNTIIDTGSQTFNKINTNSYTSIIKQSKNNDGYFLTNINGEKTLVSYLKSSIYGWTLVNLSPYNDIFSILITFRSIIFYSCLILFLIGVLYAIFASYRLYNPFKDLATQLSPKNSKNNSYIYDEAKYIKESFKKLNNYNEILEKSLSSSLVLARNTYLKQLITGTIKEDAQQLKNRFIDLHINYLEGPVCVFIIKIESAIKDNANLESGQVKDIFTIIENDFLSNNISFLFLEPELDCCQVVSQYLDYSIMLERISNIQIAIQNRLNFSVSIVMGSAANSIFEVSSSYHTCIELIPYLFVKKAGSILTNDNFNLSSRLTSCDISTYKEQLFIAIKTGSSIQTQVIIDELFKYVSNCTYDLVRLTINQLIVEIIHFSNNILADIDNSLSFNNIYQNINNISTLEETKLFFNLTCEAIIKKIDEKNKNPKKYLINDVKSFLKENYASQNLSSEYIADIFKLTPGYLGKLFSDAEGCSMVDYINDIRLSKASELIVSTSLFVNEITERCGFANRTYFATMFKKKYGLTPKAYREQNISK